MNSHRSIILIGEPRIDVLRATSILNYLRKQEPEGKITVITTRRNRTILQANPALDEILFSEDGGTMAQVLNRNYEVMYSFDNMSGLGDLANIIQADSKFGIGRDASGEPFTFNEGAEALLNYTEGNYENIHDPGMSYQHIMMRSAGLVENPPEEMIFTLPQEALSFSEALIQENRFDRNNRVIGIGLGIDPVAPARYIAQRNLSHFSEKLLNEGGWKIILFAGYRENKFYKDYFNACAPGIIEGGCCRTLTEMAGILNICDILIAQNSLALHLELALGRKVIMLANRDSKNNIELYGRGRVVGETEDETPIGKRFARYPEEQILSSAQELLAE